MFVFYFFEEMLYACTQEACMQYGTPQILSFLLKFPFQTQSSFMLTSWSITRHYICRHLTTLSQSLLETPCSLLILLSSLITFAEKSHAVFCMSVNVNMHPTMLSELSGCSGKMCNTSFLCNFEVGLIENMRNIS